MDPATWALGHSGPQVHQEPGQVSISSAFRGKQKCPPVSPPPQRPGPCLRIPEHTAPTPVPGPERRWREGNTGRLFVGQLWANHLHFPSLRPSSTSETGAWCVASIPAPEPASGSPRLSIPTLMQGGPKSAMRPPGHAVGGVRATEQKPPGVPPARQVRAYLRQVSTKDIPWSQLWKPLGKRGHRLPPVLPTVASRSVHPGTPDTTQGCLWAPPSQGRPFTLRNHRSHLVQSRGVP